MAPTEMHGKVYPSKRDAWIVLLLWAAVVLMAISGVEIWASAEGPVFRLGMSTLLLASAAFILWVLYATHYTLTSRDLVVRSGPFRWTVRLESIQEIFPTRNPLSSPACSLDRLRIRYGGSKFGIMISPEDRNGFLRELVSRTPGLRIEGARVVRDS